MKSFPAVISQTGLGGAPGVGGVVGSGHIVLLEIPG